MLARLPLSIFATVELLSLVPLLAGRLSARASLRPAAAVLFVWPAIHWSVGRLATDGRTDGRMCAPGDHLGVTSANDDGKELIGADVIAVSLPGGRRLVAVRQQSKERLGRPPLRGVSKLIPP